MAKEEAKKPAVKKKVRADKYEEKVRFDGTLEDIIKIAVNPKRDKYNK